MELTFCNVCKADDFIVLFEGPDRLDNLPGLFRLVRCRRCGLIYLNPRPDRNEIHQFYPEDYLAFQKAIDDDRSFLKRLDRRYGLYKRYRSVIEEQPRSGRILDIGCATGLFLAEMKNRGWETLGIDFSKSASDYARKRMGLEIITGDFLEVNLPAHSFDVISLWDVLEHLPTSWGSPGENCQFNAGQRVALVESAQSRLLGGKILWSLLDRMGSSPSLKSFFLISD